MSMIGGVLSLIVIGILLIFNFIVSRNALKKKNTELGDMEEQIRQIVKRYEEGKEKEGFFSADDAKFLEQVEKDVISALQLALPGLVKNSALDSIVANLSECKLGQFMKEQLISVSAISQKIMKRHAQVCELKDDERNTLLIEVQLLVKNIREYLRSSHSKESV